MVGAPVYPLANRTCPHWPNSASRQAAGSRCRRRTAPSCTLASMCRWSRRTGIVVGRSRSRPRGDDRERGHGPASCRSGQRVRAKRPGSHGQRPARPAPSGRTPARGPAGETHGPSPSTVASIRPRRHQTRRWPPVPSAPSPTSAGPDDGRPGRRRVHPAAPAHHEPPVSTSRHRAHLPSSTARLSNPHAEHFPDVPRVRSTSYRRAVSEPLSTPNAPPVGSMAARSPLGSSGTSSVIGSLFPSATHVRTDAANGLEHTLTSHRHSAGSRALRELAEGGGRRAAGLAAVHGERVPLQRAGPKSRTALPDQRLHDLPRSRSRSTRARAARSFYDRATDDVTVVAMGVGEPGRAHSRFPGHALTPTGVMAIRCKQFHLPDL